MDMTEKNTIDPNLGFEINGPGRQYFDNVMIDNLLDALVEMSAVLWTVRDRQIVLEKVLKDQGIDAANLIETYLPEPAEKAERAAERDEMVQSIFKGFIRRPNNTTAKGADDPSLRQIEDRA